MSAKGTAKYYKISLPNNDSHIKVKSGSAVYLRKDPRYTKHDKKVIEYVPGTNSRHTQTNKTLKEAKMFCEALSICDAFTISTNDETTPGTVTYYDGIPGGFKEGASTFNGASYKKRDKFSNYQFYENTLGFEGKNSASQSTLQTGF